MFASQGAFQIFFRWIHLETSKGMDTLVAIVQQWFLKRSHLFNEKKHCVDLSTTLGFVKKRMITEDEKHYMTDVKFHSSEEETVWLRQHIGNCLADSALIAA